MTDGHILTSGVALFGAVIYLLHSGSAVATTKFGAATGQPCSACHVRPDGGPDLTDFGKAFQANGNRLPKT
jgi:aerobic-type carbon monoxide dehydrogenase small subunit (CoxS/CutS family)